MRRITASVTTQSDRYPGYGVHTIDFQIPSGTTLNNFRIDIDGKPVYQQTLPDLLPPDRPVEPVAVWEVAAYLGVSERTAERAIEYFRTAFKGEPDG